MKIMISDDDLSRLAVCALRYCMGRMTYMPSVVIAISKRYLKDFTDNGILRMWEDVEMQAETGHYGDPVIDKPGWLEWREIVNAEMKRRKIR